MVTKSGVTMVTMVTMDTMVTMVTKKWRNHGNQDGHPMCLQEHRHVTGLPAVMLYHSLGIRLISPSRIKRCICGMGLKGLSAVAPF